MQNCIQLNIRMSWNYWSKSRGAPQRWAGGSSEDRIRAGVVQPGEKTISGRLYSGFPLPKNGPRGKLGGTPC